MGCLSSTFGNSAPKTKTLVNRLDRGVYEVSRRPQDTAPKDDRGPVVRTVETAQTFLTAAEVDALGVEDIRGLFCEGEPELFADVFAAMGVRAGAMISTRNRDDIAQAVTLLQGVLERATKEVNQSNEEQAAEEELRALKRIFDGDQNP